MNKRDSVSATVSDIIPSDLLVAFSANYARLPKGVSVRVVVPVQGSLVR